MLLGCSHTPSLARTNTLYFHNIFMDVYDVIMTYINIAEAGCLRHNRWYHVFAIGLTMIFIKTCYNYHIVDVKNQPRVL